MFHKIDYGKDKKFEPIRIIGARNKQYHEWDIIIGKSMLKKNIKNIKNCTENGTILELMQGMNKSIN